MSGYEEEDDVLMEQYQRYVLSNTGIPEDFDTWVQNQGVQYKKKPKKQRPRKFTDYGD
jgi:hypothetical protein